MSTCIYGGLRRGRICGAGALATAGAAADNSCAGTGTGTGPGAGSTAAGRRPRKQRRIQRYRHRGFTAHELATAKLNFGSPLALLVQPDPIRVQCDDVVDAVDADLPLECLIEDGDQGDAFLHEKIGHGFCATIGVHPVVAGSPCDSRCRSEDAQLRHNGC